MTNGLRIFGARFACLAVLLGAAGGAAPGCASSDEDAVDFDQPIKPDGGAGSSAGGFSGSSGSSGSSGFGGTGTGGFGTGGTFGSGGSGTGGGFGTGGSGTDGGFGTGGSSAGGAGSGSCNPAFCPNSGVGTPCCQTANGPCGVDTGMGCQGVQDF